MKHYVFNIEVVVDETNPNHLSMDDIKFGLENEILTPDNDHFGIVSVKIEALEV